MAKERQRFETVMYIVYKCNKHPDFETESPSEAQQHLTEHLVNDE